MKTLPYIYFSFLLIAGISAGAQLVHMSAQAEGSAPALSEAEQLGKAIFEDKTLSEPQGVSCASCHAPATYFQGNNGSAIASLAKGSRPGQFGTRNVPALMYTAFTPEFHFTKEKNEEGKEEWKAIGGQFLDGRAPTLTAQVEGPLLNAREMNNPSKAAVVSKVQKAPYASLFKKLYGEKIFEQPDSAFTKIAASVAAFESSHQFAPFSSKFDRVLEGKAEFTPQEAKGFSLFKDKEKGNCIACHVGDPNSKQPRDWLFTDYSYDNLGIPRAGDIPDNVDPAYYDLGLCAQPGLEKTLPKEVAASSLCGAFKVPTLRDIAKTAPYGHNGYFKTLRDVVKFYATRDTDPQHWFSRNADGSTHRFDDLPAQYLANVNSSEVPYDRKPGQKPRLNDEEIDAIVAFLNTLTDQP